jgi:hypothetical protein
LPGEQKIKQLHVIAAVDYTGHGVPGAFMSIIGHSLLDQVRTEKAVISPGTALDFVHRNLLLTSCAEKDFLKESCTLRGQC